MGDQKTVAGVIHDSQKALLKVFQQGPLEAAAISSIPDFESASKAEIVEFLSKIGTKAPGVLGKEFEIPIKDKLPWHLQVEFNPFLAEQLLREASLLLDRCVEYRKEHSELNAKWFESCIQVTELILLSSIAKDEEKFSDQYEPTILDSEESIVKEEETLTNQRKDKLGPVQTQIDNGINAGGSGKHQFLVENARLGLELDAGTVDKYKNIARWRVDVASATRGLKNESRKARSARNDVARIVAFSRAKQLVKDGGALNFGSQMTPLRTRFENDLRGAWLRLWNALHGFRILYETEVPPKFPSSPFDTKIDIDDLITWCQYYNTWLAAFIDRQQVVTMSFSLRGMMSDEEFQKATSLSRWEFNFAPEDFDNRQRVRLRALSVQVESGHRVGSWNVSIRPPEQASIGPKDQSHIGKLYLGRVNERTYQVIPDAMAPPKMFNCSPFGESKWILEIEDPSTLHIPPSGIEDIDIHVTVALI